MKKILKLEDPLFILIFSACLTHCNFLNSFKCFESIWTHWELIFWKLNKDFTADFENYLQVKWWIVKLGTASWVSKMNMFKLGASSSSLHLLPQALHVNTWMRCIGNLFGCVCVWTHGLVKGVTPHRESWERTHT